MTTPPTSSGSKTMADTRLWCLRAIGPDDVHPAPDFETAQKWADWANEQFADFADTLRHVVVVWPWSAEAHAKVLPRSIAEWAVPAAPAEVQGAEAECHGLDTPERICFYEQDFYVLSNFSAFNVMWASWGPFPTSEHLYHWLKFATGEKNGKLGGATASEAALAIAEKIKCAPSAHEAFKIAQDFKHLRRRDWDDVKIEFMRKILRAKAKQHEYVRRKLLATGDRELVENSWRDDFWGWGPNRGGQNMLGKLWMKVRAELRSATPTEEHDDGR
jgi:N-glycosidase YbiA